MPATPLLTITLTDVELAEQLLVLLEDEFQALAQRELVALENLLGGKQIILKQLDQHAQHRSSLLRAAGFSNDLSGLQQYASGQEEGQDLLAASARLGELIDACKQLNVRNGQIIQASQVGTSRVLNLLQGSSATPTLYNSRGNQTRSGYQRPLSSA
ncbi:flagellar protein FlgN [Pseudomonas oryzihabitans]|uniref:flagella synthesis protein FlgN n=1 Tax=Pseudomonas oryzihabitans TaxID=47885 RepID=UPI0028942AE7|nr:flagellar protein FlgN [Pseudomonas oryzihabitans]MDT3719892.1 flagellar protein FlgN [Pseudomonas oryzihabitans]